MGNLLEIKNLCIEYKSDKGFFHKSQNIHAVNNLSLDIKKGEILAIAGESGCGKSTLAKAILKLVESKSGNIYFENNDINKMNSKAIKAFRQKSQMIFQNPYASLNPKMTIFDTLREPLQINTKLNKKEIDETVIQTSQKVGIDKNTLKLYPHEFSGGQRQRIAIARALVLNPEFIVADEPVSALDVSIQAQIINLLKKLKIEYNLTFLLISHDMGVIRYLADRIAIMYLGEIVEIGSTEDIFSNPKHPYTKALLSAVPSFDKNENQTILLKGDLPNPADLPQGCKFHTRCDKCMEICRKKSPTSTNINETHIVNCFLYN